VALAKLAPATVSHSMRCSRRHARARPDRRTGNASAARLAAVVDAALADPNVDAVLAIHVARPVTGATEVGAGGGGRRSQIDESQCSARGSVPSIDAKSMPRSTQVRSPIFFHARNAVEAIAFLAAYRSNQRWLLEVPPSQPMPELPDFAAAERIRNAPRDNGARFSMPEPRSTARSIRHYDAAERRRRHACRSAGCRNGSCIPRHALRWIPMLAT